MAATCEEFYANDIVYRFDKKRRIVFGFVTESYEASSDVDEFDNLEKGQIRVWWSGSSREQIWKQNRVRLLNRSIIPGDVVRRVGHGQDTQRGYCKNTQQLITVQIVGTDKVIEKVNGTRLKPISLFLYDRTVCFDNKYGRVHNVEFKIVMQAICGSCVEVSRCSLSNSVLDDYWLAKRNRYYSGAYYPGQEIVCIPQYLHSATWIHRSKSMKRRMQARMRFTIQSVQVEAVDIVWYTQPEGDAEVDKTTVKGDDIKRLKFLEMNDQYVIELTDRMFLKLSSSDKIMKKHEWLRKQTVLYRPDCCRVTSKHSNNRPNLNRFRRLSSSTQAQTQQQVSVAASDSEEWWTDDGISDNGSISSISSSHSKKINRRHWPPRPREITAGNTLAVEVLCFESKVTVVWQDGRVEEDIPSTQLCYSVSLDDHEFFPGELVVAEAGCCNHNKDEYGSVQSVEHLERTAKVNWFRCNGEGVPEPTRNTEVSVYDLQKHYKYQYRPGSIVCPGSNTALGNLGHVVDVYPDGYVQVCWMNGSMEKHWPHELFLLPEHDYELLSELSGDYPPNSWETASIASVDCDILDDDCLVPMASKLDFIRTKMANLRDMFKQYRTPDSLTYLRDLLVIYDNSAYLDKLLGTSFFGKKSRHFRILVDQVKERARNLGVELSGRLFQSDAPLSHSTSFNIKYAQRDSYEKVQHMESTLNAVITSSQSHDSLKEAEISSINNSPITSTSDQSLCVELLSMLKARMDLAYAELVSRIGGQEALVAMSRASESFSNLPVSMSMAAMPPVADEDAQEETIPCAPTPIPTENCSEGYAVLDEAPSTHQYFGAHVSPSNPSTFFKAVKRENQLLASSLPDGVWVRAYSDRADLFSVMIRGPSKTPYEDGLFLFDLQLGPDYPHSPPSCFYISFSSERLNPNLYVEGKVCVSLLGTWVGKGSEMWSSTSTLLQVIVSIQGLILVSEPYYNEAGYEKQLESRQGSENSRTYNELVVLKLVQAMTEMLLSLPEPFVKEVISHFARNGDAFQKRIKTWTSRINPHCPDFPLLPVSKGFLLSLETALDSFSQACTKTVQILK